MRQGIIFEQDITSNQSSNHDEASKPSVNINPDETDYSEQNLDPNAISDPSLNNTASKMLPVEMIYQNPGGFSGTKSSLFYGNSTVKEKELATRVLRGDFVAA